MKTKEHYPFLWAMLDFLLSQNLKKKHFLLPINFDITSHAEVCYSSQNLPYHVIVLKIFWSVTKLDKESRKVGTTINLIEPTAFAKADNAYLSSSPALKTW